MFVRLEYRIPGVDEPVARIETIHAEDGKSFRYYAEWYDIETGEKRTSISRRPYIIGDRHAEEIAGEHARNLTRHASRVAATFHAMRREHL